MTSEKKSTPKNVSSSKKVSPPKKVSQGRVLVTGASRGIGHAVVESLLSSAAKVVAVGRDEDSLVALANLDPSRVTVVVGDLTDAAQRGQLVVQASDAMGGIDGLVNCAGVVRYADVGAISEASVDDQFSINFVAPLILSQAAAHCMRLQGTGGAIVNVASTLGLRPTRGTAVYAATKAALISITRSFALELAADQIRVSAVAPGVVDTEMVRTPRLQPGEIAPVGLEREARISDQLETLRSMHPIGRLGAAEDVASAITFLLDSPWVTGTVLNVDGGLLAS